MSDLKKFLDAKKTATRLMGDVERYLLRRPLDPRRTDVLHPSEIIKPDWCHRYSAYLLMGGKAKKENSSTVKVKPQHLCVTVANE